MDQQQTTSEPGKSRLNTEQLIDLYKHFNEIQAGKENLLIPVILAIIPAILASWQDVTTLVVIVAGVASSILYMYLLLVNRRLTSNQHRLYGKIREFTLDIEDIVRYPKSLDITSLRKILLIIIILTWVCLSYLKATGN